MKQCKTCFAIGNGELVYNPATRKRDRLICGQCPCHPVPEDAIRQVGQYVQHPNPTYKGLKYVPYQGSVLSHSPNGSGKCFLGTEIRCVKRCKSTAMVDYTPPATTPYRDLTVTQHYGVDTVAPEMAGTVWSEGWATVAKDTPEGTKFLKIKVRISLSGNGTYLVKVWDRQAKAWVERAAKSIGFNPEKALAKGTWIKVGSVPQE